MEEQTIQAPFVWRKQRPGRVAGHGRLLAVLPWMSLLNPHAPVVRRTVAWSSRPETLPERVSASLPESTPRRLWGVFGTLLLVVVLIAGIPRRTPDGEAWYGLSPDAKRYVAMVEGGPAAAPAPFCYRPLVPWIAAQLPLAADQALALVTWGSVWLSLILALDLIRCAGVVSGVSALLAILSLAGSTAFLILFQNPQLTDGFSLLTVMLGLRALLLRQAWPFVLIAAVAPLARENFLFILPALWGAPWRVAWKLACAGVGLAAFASVRLGGDENSWAAFYANAVTVPRAFILLKTGLAFGALWLLPAAGLPALPRPVARVLLPALGGSLLGLAATLVVACDATRLMVYLLPFFLVGSGLAYQRLWRLSRRWTLGFAGLLVVGGFFCVPNVITLPALLAAGPVRELETHYWHYAPVIVAQTLLAVLASVVGMWMLHRRGRSHARQVRALVPGAGTGV